MAELPVQGGQLFLSPNDAGDALFDLHSCGQVACANLTREQGTAIRDALSAWLDGDPETPATTGPSPAEQADGHPDPLPPVAGPGVPDRPEIVVLCGSTRFKDAFYELAKLESLSGRIVLTVSDLDPRPEARHVNVPIDDETKARLDELHKRKIDLADSVLVLNVGGYIGESTRSEIDYAHEHGKPVRYLEMLSPDGDGAAAHRRMVDSWGAQS